MAASGHQRPSGDGAERQDVNEDLFVDLMMGQPLSLYVDKDVEDREKVVGLIEVGYSYSRRTNF